MLLVGWGAPAKKYCTEGFEIRWIREPVVIRRNFEVALRSCSSFFRNFFYCQWITYCGQIIFEAAPAGRKLTYVPEGRKFFEMKTADGRFQIKFDAPEGFKNLHRTSEKPGPVLEHLKTCRFENVWKCNIGQTNIGKKNRICL